MNFLPTNLFSTYSIIAYDEANQQLGGAVQTHQMGVGRIIPTALPGVGVICSQSLANLKFNAIAITMLREGVDPQRIIDALVASDPDAHRRQVAVMNAEGKVAAFTGDGCIQHAAHHVGPNYSVQANMMTNNTVINAMATAFDEATGGLAERMMAALHAAQNEDGDIRGMQSAALKVVRTDEMLPEWGTIYDLRVDEHQQPVVELGRLVRMRSAQLLNDAGYTALASDDRDRALQLWEQARKQAPELEEMAFWQAIRLADNYDEVGLAVTIFNETFADDPRRAEWVELIRRIKANGLIEHPQVADDLLELLN